MMSWKGTTINYKTSSSSSPLSQAPKKTPWRLSELALATVPCDAYRPTASPRVVTWTMCARELGNQTQRSNDGLTCTFSTRSIHLKTGNMADSCINNARLNGRTEVLLPEDLQLVESPGMRKRVLAYFVVVSKSLTRRSLVNIASEKRRRQQLPLPTRMTSTPLLWT